MYDWLTYSNQGATRNMPLSPELLAAMSYLGDMGLSVDVYSGGQPAIGTSDQRVGSTRHDLGNAADVRFTHPELGMLSHTNPAHIPILSEIVARGRQNGLTGIGMGPGYMGDHGMHVGFGAPAVWGAEGSSANAPQWLRDAYYGAPAGAAPDLQQNRLADIAPEGAPEVNRLALLQAFLPQPQNIDASAFMSPIQQNPLIPIGGYS